MGLEPGVQTGKVRQQVVRRRDGRVAEEPEESGFLGVLADDLGDELAHQETRSGIG